MREKRSSTKDGYSGHYKYLILIALCSVGFIGMFCQYQMQPMANVIKESMNLTDSQYSALFMAPMVPAIFISLICGIIVDRFGGRWPMFISLVVGSIGLLGRVFAGSYGVLYMCIFAVGFAATFGNSSSAKMFGGWFSPSQSGVCIGIYMAFGAMGSVTATAFTPYMSSLKAAYVVSAAIIIVVTIFWFLFYRDRKNENQGEHVTEEQKESLLKTIEIVFKQKDIILAGFADMLLYGGIQALSAFLSIILIDKGMSKTQAGGVSAMAAAGMFAGNLVIPWIVGKVGKTKRLLFTFGALGSLLTVLVAFIQNDFFLRVILFLCGMLIGGCVPVLISLPLRLNNIGVRRTGTAQGLIATFQLFGAVVIPTYVISNLAAGNYILFVILCGCFSMVGAVLLNFLSLETEIKN